MIHAYCRVSSKSQLLGNGLEQQQQEILSKYPNAIIHLEQYTGKTAQRPVFSELLKTLNEGDTLVVTKLDRFCRSAKEGLETIELLQKKNVNVHILNMGLIENNPIGKLITTNLLAFAEFERSMIIERTQSGKEIAKQRADFREGRPKKFSKKQIELALELLKTHSYKEVEQMTGISKSTLIRAKRKRDNQ